jgi:Ala-tRNA(Pro) deacylase
MASPHQPESLLAELAKLGISYQNHHHAAVFTVAEAQALDTNLPGAHIKNLFLRSKQGSLLLVTALTHRSLNINALTKHLGYTERFSFASPELLLTHLGVTPGSVTPLALINAQPGSVRCVLDSGMKEYSLVNPHPLINNQTVALSPENLMKALTSWGHKPEWLDLSLFPKTSTLEPTPEG